MHCFEVCGNYFALAVRDFVEVFQSDLPHGSVSAVKRSYHSFAHIRGL